MPDLSESVAYKIQTKIFLPCYIFEKVQGHTFFTALKYICNTNISVLLYNEHCKIFKW